MLWAPLDWQYTELPSSASDEVMLVCKMWNISPNIFEELAKADHCSTSLPEPELQKVIQRELGSRQKTKPHNLFLDFCV